MLDNLNKVKYAGIGYEWRAKALNFWPYVIVDNTEINHLFVLKTHWWNYIIEVNVQKIT